MNKGEYVERGVVLNKNVESIHVEHSDLGPKEHEEKIPVIVVTDAAVDPRLIIK
jgi:hypothetical protein